jgi:hypothetical protein
MPSVAQRIAAVQPNPGHLALAALEQRFERFTLVTQNIDSLHQRAGSRQVVELHGNIARVKCSVRGNPRQPHFPADESPPRCHCGAWLQSGRGLVRRDAASRCAMAQAEEAAEHCEVFLSIGTSAQVYPAAELPLRALSAGADGDRNQPRAHGADAPCAFFAAGSLPEQSCRNSCGACPASPERYYAKMKSDWVMVAALMPSSTTSSAPRLITDILAHLGKLSSRQSRRRRSS